MDSIYFLTHLIVVLASYLTDTDKDRQYFYDKINVIFNHFRSSSCQDDYHGLKRLQCGNSLQIRINHKK